MTVKFIASPFRCYSVLATDLGKTCWLYDAVNLANPLHCTLSRVVVPGGAGGAMEPPDFGRLVSPISTRRDRLCPANYYWHSRIFRSSDGPAESVCIAAKMNMRRADVALMTKAFMLNDRNVHK